TGDQTTAADTYKHIIDRFARLAQNFETNRTLPFDRLDIVKRVDKRHLLLFTVALRFLERVIKRVTCQNDFYLIAAITLHLQYFLPRRRIGHKYFALDTESLAGVSDALRMIAGTGTDNTTLARIRGQALHSMISAPDFERAHHLQVFPFQ